MTCDTYKKSGCEGSQHLISDLPAVRIRLLMTRISKGASRRIIFVFYIYNYEGSTFRISKRLIDGSNLLATF